MSEIHDDFMTDEELVDWFESADLSHYNLEEAPEVLLASHVDVIVEGSPVRPETAGQTGTASVQVVGAAT